MPCYKPLTAYRGPNGSIEWDSKKGYLDKALLLPCGKCIGCRLDKARAWSLRCAHEAQLHERNCFVTLTYDDKHIPERGSLVKSHWQDFARRMRKARLPFRYLACGEYGDTTFRPHYHALMFGQDFGADRVPWKPKGDYLLYSSERLSSLWGHGFCSIGNLTRESAEYVARYTLKKVSGDLAEERYRRIDLETGEEYFVDPEFATMSRKPGIGSGWYDRFKGDLFPMDECIHEGRKYKVPRYYEDKFKAERPSDHARVRASRVRRALDRHEVALPYAYPSIGEGDSSPERLATRERVSLAKANAERDSF